MNSRSPSAAPNRNSPGRLARESLFEAIARKSYPTFGKNTVYALVDGEASAIPVVPSEDCSDVAVISSAIRRLHAGCGLTEEQLQRVLSRAE